MKQKLFFLTLFIAMLLPKVGYSQITATDTGYCLLTGDTWAPNGSVAGHTTYQTLLTCCGVACKVQWSVSNNRWEVVADVEGDSLFNDVLHYNNTNTSPNPPAMGVGAWVDSGYGCGSLSQFSGPYTTSVAPAPVITGNPPNRTICVGNNTTFSMSATGATSYQWQVNTGSGFTNISNGAPYSGATTTTLTITGATVSMNGYLFRAVATGTGSTNSNSGTLTISTIATTGSSTDISCNGGSNGSATVVASGGISPYTYSWSPSGGTSATASGLSTGNYTVTITDNIGCQATRNFTITEPSAIIATASAQTNIACNGGATGSATVSATGGTPGYTYLWSNGATTATVTGIAAGTYTVTVTDANGCTATRNFTITQPSAISTATGSQTNVSCNGGTNGSASVSPSGGTAGYTYSWSPSGGTAATATGLAAGSYTVTVTDANGCTATRNFTLTQPSAISTATG
ncbi:MAG: hypothetical protein C0412_07900, partial [Flavobacterium sp.]|nr:hypothetical protein [Flavobacterium sp.]